MPYDEKLASKVEAALSVKRNVEGKVMFSGICYMVNGKMCVCVNKDGLLCRVGAENVDAALERGARNMMMGGRVMKGYVYVDADAISKKKDFDYWINLSLEYNKTAKASPKKKAASNKTKTSANSRSRK